MPVTRSKSAPKSAREKILTPHASHGTVCMLKPAQRTGAYKNAKTLLIPKPSDVEAIMQRVPKGKLVRMGDLRAALAREARADMACPLVTGIFARLVAEAAEEDRAAGKARITPYWRAIKDDDQLIDKFPGGTAAHAALLKAEGIECQPGRGKVVRVAQAERRIWKPA
jgi:alkylated DNA nucleotide flippase Atl1